MQKKFILNADDFGLTVFNNMAVKDGYDSGVLTSASVCTNTNAFYDVVNIVSSCQNLGLGVHLNIMEGKALTDCDLLTDKQGRFNKSYLYLILNQHNKSLLTQIRAEFTAQIEKALEHGLKISHLDSHVHTHAIPAIFKITCELAKEYNIKYVRTQSEKPYITQGTNFKKYTINLIKIALLEFYSRQNKKLLTCFNLKTNDNIIGVGYTGMMDSERILSGLRCVDSKNVVEALIHPRKYSSEISHLVEYKIAQDKTLKQGIYNLGFNLSNYIED